MNKDDKPPGVGKVAQFNRPALDPDPKFKQYHGFDALHGDRDGVARILGSGTASYMDDRTTHSLGIRPHPHGHALARQLLESTGNVEVELKAPDNRPLIDKLHEATFHDPVGLQWIEDKYALRGLLRKAHCFTIDDATSEMIADFSVAIAQDLDSARRLALPPFPITWIDHNNAKRIARIKTMGLPLTRTAAGEKLGPVVERVGWLIHPATEIGGHYMTYFCEVDQGLMMAPLSYWWHNGVSRPIKDWDRDPEMDKFLHGLSLGVTESNCDPVDCYPGPTPLHIKINRKYSNEVRDLMIEIAGELRHLWGLLIAIGSAQFGLEPHTAPQPVHTDIRRAPNGKPLLPLEHKLLHLHLRNRAKPGRAILRALTHHRQRWHEVRGHIRTLRNPDGSVRRLVPVRPHERGDEKLGRIEKTYKVEK